MFVPNRMSGVRLSAGHHHRPAQNPTGISLPKSLKVGLPKTARRPAQNEVFSGRLENRSKGDAGSATAQCWVGNIYGLLDEETDWLVIYPPELSEFDDIDTAFARFTLGYEGLRSAQLAGYGDLR